jgi:hypothetical protein
MRRWIALASHDENGERLPRLSDPENLERVVVFTSGDGDEPMEGDLQTALEGHGGLEDGQEFLLVPLDAGKKIHVQTTTNIEVTWSMEAVV